MNKRFTVINKRVEKAVSDMIGTLLLLMIAVSLFSVLYFFVFSFETPDHSPSVSIIGYTDGYNITLEHWGGESLGLDSYFLITVAGENKGPYSLNDSSINIYAIDGSDGSDDDLWSFTEKLVYDAASSGISLINKELIFRIIDFDSNKETSRGKIQDGITSTAGNNPPDQAQVVYPADGGTISNDLNPSLQVRVTDPDGDSMHVSFYDASDDSLIGTDSNVVNNSIASVVWSGRSFDTPYFWYVNVTDGIGITQSLPSWSFTIVDLVPPSITIIDPNGGEIYQEDDILQINWTTIKGNGTITGIDLEYSTDNGGSWSTIETGTPDDGQYDWNIPNIHSTNCLIQGTVHDNYSLSGRDTSDGIFTIEGIPPQPPGIPTVETSSGATLIQDKTDPPSLVQGDEGSTDYFDTYSSNDIYHSILEIKTSPSGKYSLDVIYSITISAGTNIPYTLYIESYTNDSDEIYPISYEINGGGYTSLGNMGTSEAIQSWILPGISENDLVNIKIEDEKDTSGELIGAIFVDNLYIESTQGAGTSDNLVNWTRSGDDGIGLNDVDMYNVYRSEFLGDLWDAVYDNVSATGSTEYSYSDPSAGDGDGIDWYYSIRAVDEDGLDDGNTNSGQET